MDSSYVPAPLRLPLLADADLPGGGPSSDPFSTVRIWRTNRERETMSATTIEEAPVVNELVTDIPALELQAAEYEAAAEKFQAKAAAIRQIVEGIKALNGDAQAILTRRFDAHKVEFKIAPLDENGPRGTKAVIRVMREQPDRVWKVVEIKKEMLRRGWAPTPKAVEASVSRLRETGELTPVGYGFYKLPPASGASEVEEVAA